MLKELVQHHVRNVLRIYVSLNWISIASGNGLSPVRHQAITWTNADLFITVTP